MLSALSMDGRRLWLGVSGLGLYRLHRPGITRHHFPDSGSRVFSAQLPSDGAADA